MTETTTTSCASAAWRCATGCSCTARRTGPRPCARDDGSDRRRLRAQAARARRRSTRIAGRARRRPPRRGDGRHPARQARAARGAAALPGRHRRRRRWAPPRSPARCCAGARAGIGGEAALAALSLAPSLVALRGGDLAAYHGVEHKAIGAYEQGADDARDATKEHDRCGSHLMAPLLAANLAGTALLRRVGRAPVAAGRRRGPARLDRRRGRGLRVVRAPRGHRAGARAAPARPRAAARARARASRPRSSSRSAAPRWPRSCASKRRADSSAREAGEIRRACRYTRRAWCIDPARRGQRRRVRPASTSWRSSPACRRCSSR